MKSIETGKKIIIAIIIIELLANVLTNISRVLHDQDKVTNSFYGLIYIAISATILYYLYEGNKLAKWIVLIKVLLTGIAGLLFLISSILINNNALDASYIYVMFINIISLVICFILLFSKSVDNYLRFRRGELKEDSNES